MDRKWLDALTRRSTRVDLSGGNAGATDAFVSGGTSVSGSVRGGGIVMVGETDSKVYHAHRLGQSC